IMSTGNGQIKVLDGYGRVNVNNTTGKTLDIGGIDLGSEVEGRLRINDAGLLDGNDNKLTSTIYTRVGNNVQVYRGAFADVKTTAAYQISNTAGRSATYNPRAGLDYIWLDGTSYEEKHIKVAYSDTAIGFIPSGSGNVTLDIRYPVDIPRAIDASDYLAENRIP